MIVLLNKENFRSYVTTGNCLWSCSKQKTVIVNELRNPGKLSSDFLCYFITKQKLNNHQFSTLEEHAGKMHPPDQQNSNGNGDVLSTVVFWGYHGERT